jgi:hypothetical protein
MAAIGSWGGTKGRPQPHVSDEAMESGGGYAIGASSSLPASRKYDARKVCAEVKMELLVKCGRRRDRVHVVIPMRNALPAAPGASTSPRCVHRYSLCF